MEAPAARRRTWGLAATRGNGPGGGGGPGPAGGSRARSRRISKSAEFRGQDSLRGVLRGSLTTGVWDRRGHLGNHRRLGGERNYTVDHTRSGVVCAVATINRKRPSPGSNYHLTSQIEKVHERA